MTVKKKVLVVDDEEIIRELVRDTLENEGYEVSTAEDTEKALRSAAAILPDIIILDLGIPTIGGLEVCRILRKENATHNIPIIMLTARSSEIDKVIGLEIGADDYITKPFNQKEFIARVKAVIRRNSEYKKEKKIVTAGPITVDTDAHIVIVDGIEKYLRPKEFDILLLLIEKKGSVLTREYLCETVLGYEYFGSARSIDAHIKNIRQALGAAGDLITTVRGVGYRMMKDAEI